MAVNIDKLRKLIEVFYQPPFKVFNVNSVDGSSFIRPIGVFVSLGITSSSKVINDIKTVINTDDFVATCVKISSKKVGGQYLNTIVDNTLTQFEEKNLPDNTFNRDSAIQEINRLQSVLREETDTDLIQKLAPQVSILQDLIEKLDSTSAWDRELIWRDEEGTYKIFHKLVNYLKVGDTEYRLGIFVREK